MHSPIEWHGKSYSALSLAGATIVKVAYGYESRPLSHLSYCYFSYFFDHSQAGRWSICRSCREGSWKHHWLNKIPCQFLSVLCVSSTFLYPDSISDHRHTVKYVPDWFPGTGFKQQAKIGRKLAHDVLNLPFMTGKEKIVSQSSQKRTWVVWISLYLVTRASLPFCYERYAWKRCRHERRSRRWGADQSDHFRNVHWWVTH